MDAQMPFVFMRDAHFLIKSTIVGVENIKSAFRVGKSHILEGSFACEIDTQGGQIFVLIYLILICTYVQCGLSLFIRQ